jgi:dipeptidyl aminopeptidase/acylaminoacyl peptidase
LVISAGWGRPPNELVVFDWRTKKGWRLVYPNPHVKLLDPVFSKDGQRIAFVVTPPHYAGRSEIWVADVHGRNASLVAGGDHFYRFPVFSPDGSRMAYARDVDPPPIAAPVLKENRQAYTYAFFETDLGTGSELRMAERTFGWVCGIYYGATSDSFHVCAADPLIPSSPTGELKPLSLALGFAAEEVYRQDIGGAQNLLLRRGEQHKPLPTPFAPPSGTTKGARVIGADATGSAILQAGGEPETFPAYRFTSNLTLYDGKSKPVVMARVEEDRAHTSDWRASADAKTFIVEQSCKTTVRADDCREPPTYLVVSGGDDTSLSFADLALDPQDERLAAPAGSTLPSGTDTH